MDVHSALGPGLLESAYETCLRYELKCRGIPSRVQHSVPLIYKGIRLDAGFRMDLLVDDAIVVELKTVDKILPIHEAQLLSYLKLGRFKIGLLINFHTVHLRDGIKRMVNGI